ncbi:hypothetical protein QFW82_27235 [Streptomyces malaysiensis subsp. malaysiensis]|uniref:hypothetical protein n=1 Tax=Streptomyces sp. NA07423 TaxID=3042026 RepID=UPI0024BF713E|nr:hypothetical protein [Streptomyces sp. NA07423]WHX20468.1 hypothetical protein QFW82_27235 [Streptomyces sp. NA07423]
MSARRPLLTAAAAGSLLCALWFVPSANATVEDPGASSATSQTSGSSTEAGPRTEAVPDGDLADTGSVDITPYLFGGTAFLGLGVAMVTASVRRTRPEAY